MQVTDPAAAYVPAAQVEQGVAGSVSRSTVPASHALQETCAAGVYLPLAQATHGVLGAESVSAVPLTQSAHATELASEYEPGEHGMQLVLLAAPFDGRNVPRLQGLGNELPAGQ